MKLRKVKKSNAYTYKHIQYIDPMNIHAYTYTVYIIYYLMS